MIGKKRRGNKDLWKRNVLKKARINSNSFKHHVLIGSQRLEVCFKAFLSLHSITNKRVKRSRALKCLGKGPIDKREKHVKKPHSVQTRQLLRQHINIIVFRWPIKQTTSRKTLTYTLGDHRVIVAASVKSLKTNSKVLISTKQLDELQLLNWLYTKEKHPNFTNVLMRK